jgi:hypothetical protein
MGATFCGNETAPTIIGWFNNLPYHSIPLAVQTIYNTILRYYTYNKTISVVNHPLPFTEDTVVTNFLNVECMIGRHGLKSLHKKYKRENETCCFNFKS